MKILFVSPQLCYRGTTDQVYQYAHYSEIILGHTSFVASPRNADRSSLDKFTDRFGGRVYLYNDRDDLTRYVEENNIDVVYYIRYGTKDWLLDTKAKQVVHAVFNVPYEENKHGDRFAYISPWLSRVNEGAPYVPHIVDVPDPAGDYREHLGIPRDAVVYVRHGGADSFNIPYVQETVYKVASQDPSKYFLFLNTDVFCPSLPNVIHIDPTTDKEVIAGFLATGDAFLYARDRGESFGLAIGEACKANLPVICPIQAPDRNHIEMLGDQGLYYSSPKELEYILKNFQSVVKDFTKLVEQYNAPAVMEQFSSVFLK